MALKVIDSIPSEDYGPVSEKVSALLENLPESFEVAKFREIFTNTPIAPETEKWLNRIEVFKQTGNLPD